MTFDEITTDIASVLNNMYNRAQNNPEELQKVQQYQNQLAQLTDNFDNASKSTSNLYSAMSLHANNTRFLLGL